MTAHPKKPADLALAPVAVEIDQNLQPLRDAAPALLLEELVLSLNTEPGETPAARAKQVLELATRRVDMHGWAASISADSTRIELRGGSVGLDVGLSAALRDYIELGPG
jgi:hypothetical protein